MNKTVPVGRPQWHWEKQGGARLFGADGSEFVFVDRLSRLEVERLLGLRELDAVGIECGSGVTSWVTPSGAGRLWSEVEPWLDDVEPWHPPPGAAGALPYQAGLWRAADGRHVLVFVNEVDSCAVQRRSDCGNGSDGSCSTCPARSSG